ncbi:glycosyltransferase [Mesotoga sp. H07.pep.5.3]|uniref:glycosyltransferase n=1 Tax=Mesotoga sp. H07.pep.5.3 TaxID=1421003 RepID=UPI000C18EB7F|nr:glycosyltransferase [Mesotoga sp. H07.pep.5.3]
MDRLLIFSEMFPKPKSSSSGVFIVERLKALTELGVPFDFAPVSTFDNFPIRLVKKLKGYSPSEPIRSVNVNQRKYPVLNVSLGLRDRIGLIRQEANSWVRYAHGMAIAIERNKKIEEFHLLHAHRVFPEGYAAMLLSEKHKIPYIVTAHGGEIHSISNNNKAFVKEVLEKAAKAIFVSKALMKDACEKLGYDKSNGIVIPNGVDTNVFKLMDKEGARKKLSLPLNKKIVGFVGNLIEVKGADRLPAIARELMKLRSDVFFLIVGDGPLINTLRECMPTDLTHFAGRVEYELMPVVMNAIDVLVVPSRQEGFGTVILEARACGARVVGTNVGGIPEAIGDERVLSIDSEDLSEELAQIISWILSDELELASESYCVSSFDWHEIAMRERDIYEKIIDETAKSHC